MKTYKTEEGRKSIYESYDRLMAQWGVDAEELDIEGRYGTTHIIAAGKKENHPLFLFHGVGDNSAMMWLYNAKALSENFRIYAVDAIGGAGKSVPGPSYGKGFNQTLWVSELLDALEISKTHVAGVSYGCYLVQLLKAKMPERIVKSFGMAGSIYSGSSRGGMIRMMKAFLPEALFPTDKNVEKLIRKLSGEHIERLTENSELMHHWKLLLRQFNNMSMGYHSIIEITNEEIMNIRGSLKLLVGDRDILSYHPQSLENMDGAGIDYEIIEGCGHAINHEQPEMINRKILEFLI